jgi:hypothetical protein
MRHEIQKIFNDLDDYKRFCTVFGHPYDEAALYDNENAVYEEYAAFKNGKRIANNWIRDAKIFRRNIFGVNNNVRI